MQRFCIQFWTCMWLQMSDCLHPIHSPTEWLPSFALDVVMSDFSICILIYCLILYVGHSHILRFTQNEVYNATKILWNGVHLFVDHFLSMCAPQHTFVNFETLLRAQLHLLSTTANQILEHPFTNATSFPDIADQIFYFIFFKPYPPLPATPSYFCWYLSAHEKSLLTCTK